MARRSPRPLLGGVSVSTGVTLAASASCTMIVNVTGTSEASAEQHDRPDHRDGERHGRHVQHHQRDRNVAPPTMSKAFGTRSLRYGASIDPLTFTISNPNSAMALDGRRLHRQPAGRTRQSPCSIASPGSCGGGTITRSAGSEIDQARRVPPLLAGAGCTFSVQVTGIAVGTQANQCHRQRERASIATSALIPSQSPRSTARDRPRDHQDPRCRNSCAGQQGIYSIVVRNAGPGAVRIGFVYRAGHAADS